MYNTGYPVAKFNWQDNSGASTDTLFQADDSGLFVPFQIILAERGVPGELVFGGSATMVPKFGSETFDPSSKFYTPATQFLAAGVAAAGGVAMRLCDPDATAASFGLFVQYYQAPVVQYQKASDGTRLLDSSGNPKPRLQVESTQPVTETGIYVRWFTRELTDQETLTGIAPVTQQISVVFPDGQNNSVQATTVPIITGRMPWPGSAGNRQGFKLYSTGSDLAAVANDITSVLYRFAPYALPTSVSTTASPISDNLGSNYNDVSFKNQAVYSKTGTNYAFKYILGSNYVDSTTYDSLLPYDMHVYSDNVAAVGTAILGVSPELTITDPYLIDLISGQDLDGLFYDHMVVDSTSATVVNSNSIAYATGGTDGEVSFAKLQELITDWASGTDFGEFTNVFQWPLTHYTDPGFAMTTKYAILNLLDQRDNVKIDLATQDVSLPANTKAQDLSAALMLQARAMLHPESVINGVGCTRVGIYAHAAELASGNPYTGLVPFTYNRLIQRRDLDGGTYIKGSAGGFPNSQVTLFKKPNWTADNDATRLTFWEAACNTVMHASRTEIFYPSIRTIYPNDTSLLSDDEISDRVIYIMRIARRKWALYAGRREDLKDLFTQIEKEINDDCAKALNGDNLQVRATLKQTAMDANLGYAYTCDLTITGRMPARQFTFNIIMQRATA